MKERPILFSGSMVRALLAGTKTQTRRVVKPQPRRVDGGVPFGDAPQWAHAEPGTAMMHCPHGKRGDRLWVREAFCKIIGQSGGWIETDYRATYTHGFRLGDSLGIRKKWTPSIHMPRDASRITLEITSVRVERLQDISEADARAEGCTQNHNGYFWGGPHQTGGLKQMATALQAYQDLWESINGPGSWDANPWVWVLEFRRLNAEQSPC